MKRLLTFALTLLATTVAVPAMAQQAATPPDKPDAEGISLGDITPTPEMWFYQQEREQYQDPKEAVRQKAEFRTSQRQYRMASRKWFGFSNQRPSAGVDPVHGDYSPRWTSGSTNYPFRWSGSGRPWVVLRPAVPLSNYY